MTKSSNANLHKANAEKNDEFYTQLPDIEKELSNYRQHFKGKTVFCNCDDPEESNFVEYFSRNFEFLGLKKLISTHFEKDKPSYKLEIQADVSSDGKVNQEDFVRTPLKENGDFRSPEAIELLKKADIVCTNPPFSLFREYLAQLIQYDKKFVIIGNKNAITYKETFKLIRENRLWLGHSSPKEFKISGNVGVLVTQTIQKFGNIGWFTNVPVSKRTEHLVLHKIYRGNEADYPTYDNYDAINVDKTKDIPVDYTGAMGVPITFLDKYNPEQFEIVGLGNSRANFTPNKDYRNPLKVMGDGTKRNGNAINCVLAVESRTKPGGGIYYVSDNSGYLTAPYARILIRHKTGL